MTDYTPGPWVITTGGDDETIVTSTRDADGLDDDVALVYGGNDADPATCEANARLIAAAPDLLAALESIEEQIRLIGIEDWHGAEGLDVSVVRAAIAKALGEN